MSDSPILVDVQDRIAWVTLNRPDAMNAVNRALVDSLDDVLQTLGRDSNIRVIVITGKGRAFCAGGDLKGFLEPDGSINPEELLRFVEYSGSVFSRIAELPKPVIAAINGLALAGGLELALACDLVVAAESARLGDAHANFGLLPGGGGAARLVRVVGPMVAKYLAFTGEALPAASLVHLGLVNEVVPDVEFVARVRTVASRMAEKSAPGLARMKRLINEGMDQDLPTALKAEHMALLAQLGSKDALEGLNAFREHRSPQFSTSR